MESNLNRDQELWKKARERAGFKLHLIVYIIFILFLWLLWAFIGYVHDGDYGHKWPLYPMFGWGLVIILHYLIVFNWKHKITQKEYEKLLKNK